MISNISILVSEFVGTTAMIFIGLMVTIVCALRGMNQMVSAAGWACAVFAGASLADHSGAHLNPAVTVAQVLTGKIMWEQVPFYLVGQLSGACFGSILAAVVFYVDLHANRELENLVSWFATSPRVTYLHALIIECLATSVLVSWILSSPRASETEGVFNFGNSGLGYLGVALIVFVLSLAVGEQTGAALNPARDLGPRIVYTLLCRTRGYPSANWRYAWVPVLGPFLGAGVGVLFSSLLQEFR